MVLIKKTIFDPSRLDNRRKISHLDKSISSRSTVGIARDFKLTVKKKQINKLFKTFWLQRELCVLLLLKYDGA